MSFLNYCFVSGITPGPADICSLSTAIRKGRKTNIETHLRLPTDTIIMLEVEEQQTI